MAMLQITVSTGRFDLEAAVVMKQFVACGDQDIVATDCNAAQTPVATPALEVDLAGVPVDHLHDVMILKINQKYAAVTLAFAAAAYDRCCDELWQSVCHSIVIL